MEAAERVSVQPALPDPSRTGNVPLAVFDDLFEIISFVGENWQVKAYSGLTYTGFQSFVNLNTQAVPSYLTVYGMTSAMYRALQQRLGSKVAALKYLYTPNPPAPPANWNVVRAWSIQEFLNLYVSRGAFRTYGWLNYSGFQGGPFQDPSHLPYRPCLASESPSDKAKQS
jgi:hypothetical protein